jgi:hypothetical protein
MLEVVPGPLLSKHTAYHGQVPSIGIPASDVSAARIIDYQPRCYGIIPGHTIRPGVRNSFCTFRLGWPWQSRGSPAPCHPARLRIDGATRGTPKTVRRTTQRIVRRIGPSGEAYQQAGAPSWVTAAFGALATGPVKTPQVVGAVVTAGLVTVALQPAALT